jgi:hypothetical protein
MVFVAALIAIEKLFPWKAVANSGIAGLLVALGIAVSLVPGQVPGLTLPDSPEARDAMMQMDGGSMKRDEPMKDSSGGSMKGESMKGDSMK